MKIRVKFESGGWWAYFNDSKESHIVAWDLPTLCKNIKIFWPSNLPNKNERRKDD